MNASIVELVGIILQSILYGMYLVSSGIATYSMHCIRARKITPNTVVMGTSTLLFLFITLYYVLSIVRAINGFVVYEENPARLLFFLQFDAIQATRTIASYCAIALMEALLVYRLYVIYLCDIRIVMLPALTIIAFVAFTTVQIVFFVKRGSLVNAADILGWPPIDVVLSVFSSTYSTSFIIFRIVKDGFVLQSFTRKNIFGPVLYIVIESALVSTILAFAGLVLYQTRRYDAFTVYLHLFPPLIGLNYTIILIHIGLGITNISQLTVTLPTIKQSSFSNEAVVADKSRRSIIFLTINTPEEDRELERHDAEESSGEPAHQDASTAKHPTL